MKTYISEKLEGFKNEVLYNFVMTNRESQKIRDFSKIYYRTIL